ncbi:glycosyltransferase family 39 protein [bacterium]|nr:glycosyltransferase family 39 protein [bacterium]
MKRGRDMMIAAALALMILTGGALRFLHIGTPSMWVDEANTVFSAEALVKTGMPDMPTGNVYGRAPLYTYSVALMYRLGGVSLENARNTSAIYGILCIPFAFIVASMLFGWRTGLVTAFFMSVSYFEIGWSRVARMYTQFQLLTLISVLFFILGFERHDTVRFPDRFFRPRFLFSGIRVPGFGNTDPVALLIFVLVTLITYFGVHLLAVFTAAGLGAYIVIRAIHTWIFPAGANRMKNKYTVCTFLFIAGGLFSLAIPQIRHLLIKFLHYTPAWAAEGASSASQTGVLFRFLFSWYRFPLGLLSLAGLAGLVRGGRRSGWMAAMLLIVPLLILSFVFTHRHTKYLFFVYPFFLMLAAYGTVRLVLIKPVKLFSFRSRSVFLTRRWTAGLIVAAFLISPWLRIAKNIPFLDDGKTNGAVYFNEWREAAELLHRQMQPGDCVISSLPEVMLYYRVASDWALNGNNLALSASRKIYDSQGRFMEVFAGRPLVDSPETLKRLMRESPRGWIVMTDYHFSQPLYTPPVMKQIIEARCGAPQWTTNRTVRIYAWDHGKGEAHEF